MDSINRVLLDRIQRNFPLVSQPYDALSEGLAIDGAGVRERIKELKDRKMVRQISAIFNTGALGYMSSLVAMAVPASEVERAAEAINTYPGVSHNYLRPGVYNMWYTIAVPPGETIEQKVQELSRSAGGWPSLILPAAKKFKLAVVLDVLDESEGESGKEIADLPPVESSALFQATTGNIEIVRRIQEDLPLDDKPFKVWADRLGMEEESLLGLMRQWNGSGLMRRFAAVLNHRLVGFSANAMIVWNSPEDKIDEYGRILSSHPEVSHCYHRPSYPEWPYNLYVMVHGRTPEECERIAGKLGASIELNDYKIMISTREFKKIRLKLFW